MPVLMGVDEMEWIILTRHRVVVSQSHGSAITNRGRVKPKWLRGNTERSTSEIFTCTEESSRDLFPHFNGDASEAKCRFGNRPPEDYNVVEKRTWRQRKA